jgi:hypothetical protein
VAAGVNCCWSDDYLFRDQNKGINCLVESLADLI